MSQPTILCVTSYHKGEEFIRECKRMGCRVLLLTVEKLKDADWPMESVDERFLMPDLFDRQAMIDALSYLARTERLSRIVALDEFDVEMAAAVREHMRLPGMGETIARHFRDKLAMRVRAQEAGIAVPAFVPVLHHAHVTDFLRDVPPPWILKPRTSASAIGVMKLDDPDEVWRVIHDLGDRQSSHLIERFVPGRVLHVDSVVWDGEVRFAESNGYVNPPFAVYHGGGVFATRTLARGTDNDRELREMNGALVSALGMHRGVLHTEFIRADEDGRLYFLETAARVGGAHIVDMVEAATGVNLWREWARVEVADARGEQYQTPESRQDYAGLIVSLARQEWPDLSAYGDPEIAWRMHKRHHTGLIVASPSRERVVELLDQYMRRFRDDFSASMPALSDANEATE